MGRFGLGEVGLSVPLVGHFRWEGPESAPQASPWVETRLVRQTVVLRDFAPATRCCCRRDRSTTKRLPLSDPILPPPHQRCPLPSVPPLLDPPRNHIPPFQMSQPTHPPHNLPPVVLSPRSRPFPILPPKFLRTSSSPPSPSGTSPSPHPRPRVEPNPTMAGQWTLITTTT